ncbi:hypothetical protein BC567DRAFT_57088 [Phyllosticta citribraziliensis]
MSRVAATQTRPAPHSFLSSTRKTYRLSQGRLFRTLWWKRSQPSTCRLRRPRTQLPSRAVNLYTRRGWRPETAAPEHESNCHPEQEKKNERNKRHDTHLASLQRRPTPLGRAARARATFPIPHVVTDRWSLFIHDGCALGACLTQGLCWGAFSAARREGRSVGTCFSKSSRSVLVFVMSVRL